MERSADTVRAEEIPILLARIAQLERQVATLLERDEWLVQHREELVNDDLRRFGVQA